MNRSTVLGARGFVGRHLAEELRSRGREVYAPERDADLAGEDLGTVYYCIGLTADFRHRPFDTVTAHVGKLQQILQTAGFERLVYCSSTRVYDATGTASTAEDAPQTVNSSNPSDLYNLSKLMGESLVLHTGKPGIVARLSNVFGPDWESENFLTSLIGDAVRNGRIALRSDPESAKDYLGIRDTVRLMIEIAERGTQRIYNVASGRNVSHAKILERLRAITGCEIELPGGPKFAFPPIDVRRVQSEFGFTAEELEPALEQLVSQYRQWIVRPA